MNREIKFRAWIKNQKRMRKVIGIDFFNKEVEFEDDDSEKTYHLKTSFNDAELIQYTGVTDINNKEIYEGDVVKVIDCLRENYGMYNVLVECDFYQDFGKGYEIIGNIYENPELLESFNKKATTPHECIPEYNETDDLF